MEYVRGYVYYRIIVAEESRQLTDEGACDLFLIIMPVDAMRHFKWHLTTTDGTVRNGLIKCRFVVWGFDMQIDMLIGLNRQWQWHIRISSHQMINIIANVILSPLCIELNDWPMIKWDGQEPRLGVTRWSLWLYGHPDARHRPTQWWWHPLRLAIKATNSNCWYSERSTVDSLFFFYCAIRNNIPFKIPPIVIYSFQSERKSLAPAT